MTHAPAHKSESRLKRAVDLMASCLLQTIRVLFFASPFLLSIPQLAKADIGPTTNTTIEYVESSDDSILGSAAPGSAVNAQFGPFSFKGGNVAELNGVIDQTTPEQVRRMLALYPGISLIRMIDCPGTENDEANLEVARMIRRAGISTFVPKEGSVRSGGVDLFLAGVHHTAEPGAEFGVHSWEDENGRQARDVPASDPAHQAYLRYYQDIGLTPEQASAFYAFTNQASFDNIHYMTQHELALYHITN